MKFQHIAVLIDAENVSANKISDILHEIEKMGNIRLRYAYGNFRQENLAIWDQISLKYLLKQIHTPSLVKGKNASDIALVIDAMDLLFHGHNQQQLDCFCIVSSDSDFGGLVKYIRQKGKTVIGVGRSNTIDSFKLSCNQFISIDDGEIKLKRDLTPIDARILKQDTALINAIRDSIKAHLNKEGWANYSQINNYLNQKYPKLKVENYGYKKWRILIEKIDLFEIKQIGNIFYFSIKSKPKLSQIPVASDIVSKKDIANDSHLLGILKQSVSKNLVDGWANYSQVNTFLSQNYPKLTPQKYGYTKWRKIFESIDVFDIKVLKNGLYIRETALMPKKEQVNNKRLVENIAGIINSTVSVDGWVHIGYLGSQLKNQGYNPKDYGFKNFRIFLESVKGVIVKEEKEGIFFSLEDRSKIRNQGKTQKEEKYTKKIYDSYHHFSYEQMAESRIKNGSIYYQQFGQMPDSSIDYIDEFGYPHWD